jgi:FkbM family methyltransferase
MKKALIYSNRLRRTLKSFYMAIPLKKQIFSVIRTFWTPPPSIYRYLYFRDKFRIDVGQRCFYMNHYGYDIETSIFWKGLTGGWEKISLSLWIQLCKQSNIILDIGANTGIYSLVAKAVNAQSKVYSFEPVKRVYDKLVANRDLNAYDIVCQQTALSDYDGEGMIYDLATEHIYSVTLNKNLHCTDLPVTKTKVLVQKISTFLEHEGLSRIDLMKIDVESHEPEVIEGMGKYVRSMKPTILLEVWNNEIGNRLEEMLTGCDYLFFNTDEMQPFKRTEHIRNPDPSKGYQCYLVCSPHIADYLTLEY